VASDNNIARITASHNLYILREVIGDLITGYDKDPDAHREIAASKDGIADAITGLQLMLAAMEKADTIRQLN
jgi:hypothetical protein